MALEGLKKDTAKIMNTSRKVIHGIQGLVKSQYDNRSLTRNLRAVFSAIYSSGHRTTSGQMSELQFDSRSESTEEMALFNNTLNMSSPVPAVLKLVKHCKSNCL